MTEAQIVRALRRLADEGHVAYRSPRTPELLASAVPDELDDLPGWLMDRVEVAEVFADDETLVAAFKRALAEPVPVAEEPARKVERPPGEPIPLHVVAAVTEKLLPLYNETWRFYEQDGEDVEAPLLDAEGFARELRLTRVDGTTYWIDPGDLFWGHVIEAYVADDGTITAALAG